MLTLKITRPRDGWVYEMDVHNLTSMVAAERMNETLVMIEPHLFKWEGEGFRTNITYGPCEFCKTGRIVPLAFDIREYESFSLVTYDDGEPWRGERYDVPASRYPYWTTACGDHADSASQTFYEWKHDV